MGHLINAHSMFVPILIKHYFFHDKWIYHGLYTRNIIQPSEVNMGTLLYLAALLFFASCAIGGVIDNEILREFINEEPENKENHWALIVAGSNGWGNYRHQADACHAYQIMKKHGIPEERIVTMMYDDIALNPENPTSGIIINHLNGPDVYGGVKIDYSEADVTPENFLAVLKGDSASVKGGDGRVIKSGPNDHVFVYFVDHGGQGLVAFPSGYLYATTLVNAIKAMHSAQKYKQLVFYMEACESGSMFETLLPKDINVFVTTASNSHESSYACYFDSSRSTYLGDWYSVNWMEDSDREDLSVETLQKQYQIVKKETNTSHVMEYGDVTIAGEPVSEFQGGKTYVAPQSEIYPKVSLDAVPSEQVPLAILSHRLSLANSKEEEFKIVKEMKNLLKLHAEIEATVKHIVAVSTKNGEQATRLLSIRHQLVNYQCYEAAVDVFDDKCFDLSRNDYAMRKLYHLVNLCEEGITAETIIDAINMIC